MKKGLDDALMVSIGSMGPKGGRMPPDEGYMEDEEMIEEEALEYSDEQHAMA